MFQFNFPETVKFAHIKLGVRTIAPEENYPLDNCPPDKCPLDGSPSHPLTIAPEEYCPSDNCLLDD